MMRIAQLAPLIESVPPVAYGGIELVVSLLTEELVSRGHEVTLFASGDSTTSARLVPVIDGALRRHQSGRMHLWNAFHYRSLMALESMCSEFDIVHNHMGWLALPFLAKLPVPVLTTNHNIIEPAVVPVYEHCSQLPYVAISRSYLQSNLPEELNYVDIIYNGIDITRYRYDDQTERTYLAFLGRLCEDKGIVEALEIARRLDLPLKIAGKVDPLDCDYFERNVRPYLGEHDIEYIGEVDHEGKVELFRNAIALVYPINFDEPFGLVMAEAMACGVPPLALDRGSVREVLDEETAVVGSSVEELVERFDEVSRISRAACRRRVETLFSKRTMVDKYEAAFERVTLRNRLEAMTS